MVRTNPDLVRRDFTWKDYCRAEDSYFNRENTLTVRLASISRGTQKKFFFYRRAETRRVGTSLAVQWLLSAFQCRGTKIARALGQMSLCAPTREAPKHRNLGKACHNNKDAAQPNKRTWGSGMNRSGVVRWWITHRFPKSSLLSGGAVSWGRACGKDRILTKIWLGSILFHLISGNK